MSDIARPHKQKRICRYINYNLYFYSSTATILWSSNKVRESPHIYFFCGEDPYWEVVQRPENTRGADCLLERPAGPTSLERPMGVCLCLSDHWISTFSPNFQTLYCLFKSQRKYEHPLHLTYFFLFVAGYRNLHTFVFFFVICWSYLRT